ncbi:5-methylthioadenosine/S-adenosylhomocysteine deaminase [Lachnospiraceae bacterium]|nr:5-methylthioadenosine/S-adenosylhomocysteine deaminase [Lachnospiraceae bacterium]
MNTRIYNARLLTMDGNTDVIENGEVLIKGNTILYAGTAEGAVEYLRTVTEPVVWNRDIDANGNLVMPGFKNAHTHSGMTFLRSAADDMKLDAWLTQQIFPREALLTPDDIYIASKLAVLEYLTSGVTAVCEMYLAPDRIADAMEDSGMRCVQCGGMNNFSQSIELQREWFDKLNKKDSLNSYRLGIHAEYTTSKELLEETAALAKELKAPVYLHNSETEKEVQECKERYNGLTPTEALDEMGMFEYGGTFFHGVHVTDHDMEIMKKHNIAVVTNPASNLKLASGIAPIEKYMQNGITLGIGTDGPASNNCLDMFREMFLVTGLGKVRENDASAIDAAEVLKMAAVGGAHAIGLTDCDALAAGKKADIIMLDMHAPNMQPINNIVKNVVYSGSKSNVLLTMIDGKILYEKGEFNIGEDPEKIYHDVQAIIDRMR